MHHKIMKRQLMIITNNVKDHNIPNIIRHDKTYIIYTYDYEDLSSISERDGLGECLSDVDLLMVETTGSTPYDTEIFIEIKQLAEQYAIPIFYEFSEMLYLTRIR